MSWLIYYILTAVKLSSNTSVVVFSVVEDNLEIIEVIWSRREAQTVDALAVRGDEGRGILRKALGSWKQALIQRCPNGGTRLYESRVTYD